jgi:retron-type reverse transcriptase
VGEIKIKLSDAVCEQKPLFSQTLCEARQMYIKKEAKSLFKLFNNKIYKASKIVQETFTLNNIFNSLIMLELALLNYSQNGYDKYNLQKLFCDPCFLLHCYIQLKYRKLSEVDNFSVQKVTLSAILSLSTKLVFRTYKPKPTRRVFIRGVFSKMRPVAIMSTLDAIVQKAVLTLLKPIFEKQFIRCSYGFRENKNCHTCLSSIYYAWTGVKWFIEADFLNCVGRISHLNLMCLINKYFHNYYVSQVIYLMLRVGYIHFGNTINSELESNFGISQSSLLSSFFCNILLHELDVFAVNLCNNFSYNKKIIFSKNYIKLVRYLNVFWENTWHLVNSKVKKNSFENKVNKTSSFTFLQEVAVNTVKNYKKDYS